MPLAQTCDTARTVALLALNSHKKGTAQRNDQRQDHHGRIEQNRS